MRTIECQHTRIEPFPITVIVSRFNESVTSLLQQSAIAQLHELGFHEEQITVIKVPGAVEIPLVAKLIANKGRAEAIIALGAVIRGETTHYDYVCSQVSQGCQEVALDFQLPVVFGVLTTENREQALVRANGTHSDKGREAVDTACEMVNILRQL